MKNKIINILQFVAKIFFYFPLYPIFYLINLIYPFKFSEIIYNRIGHLAANTDLFIRRRELGLIDNKIHFLFFCGPPCNKQLLKMWKRYLTIIDNPLLYRIFFLFLPTLRKSPFFFEITFTSNEYYPFSKGTAPLKFNQEELRRGKDELKKMGIGENDWYVCFHARDPAYLDQVQLKMGRNTNSELYSFRDCNVKNYLQAAEFITQMGGFAIRMGSLTTSQLNNDNPKIIDYANKFQSDFMDIFLLGTCKFFLGNTSGPLLVSTAFGIPVACANFIPVPHTPLSHQDLFIPKLLMQAGKILTYKQLTEMGLMGWLESSEIYQKLGVDIIENSPEDILDLCKEMYQQTKTNYFIDSEKQIQYKVKYLKDHPNHHQDFQLSGRLCQAFLQKYQEIF